MEYHTLHAITRATPRKIDKDTAVKILEQGGMVFHSMGHAEAAAEEANMKGSDVLFKDGIYIPA